MFTVSRRILLLIPAMATMLFVVGSRPADAAICSTTSPGGVECLGGQSWCGNTCQNEPAIQGNQTVNCSSCAPTCPSNYPCATGSLPYCIAATSTPNTTACSGTPGCPATSTTDPAVAYGVFTNQCSSTFGCVAGSTRCASLNKCAKTLSCAQGYTFDECANSGNGACTSPYIITTPASTQSASINVSGPITSGNTVTANGIQVDPNNTNAGSYNPSNIIRFGSGSTGIGSQNSSASLDLYTSGLKRLSVLNSGTLTFPQQSTAYALQTSNSSLYVNANPSYPGVVSYGSFAGGFFQNSSSGANVYLGYGSYPIYASGPCAGYFSGTGGYASLSCSGYAGYFNGLVYAQSLSLPGANALRIGTAAVAGYVLTANAGGYASWQQGFGGSGTANYLPKFIGPKDIANSTIYQSVAGDVGIGTASPGQLLHLYKAAGDTKVVIEGMGTQYDQSVEFKDVGGSWFVGQRWQTTNNDFGIGTSVNKDQLVFSATGAVEASGNMNAPAGCFGPKYVGRSAATTGVITNGYNGANAMCASFGAGAHVCSIDEVFMSIKCGAVSGLADNDAMWINGGPPGYLAPANDCTGWSNGTGSAYGRKWIWVNSNGGRGALGTCNESIPLGCCR